MSVVVDSYFCNMKIKLTRIGMPYKMEATNETGNTLWLDSGKGSGGTGEAFSPMQAVLASLGGCSVIDIISILEKQHQKVEEIQVYLEAERKENEHPAVFTRIHIQYEVYGNIEYEKMERAMHLSMDKYCSVAAMLNKTAEITYAFKLNPSQL